MSNQTSLSPSPLAGRLALIGAVGVWLALLGPAWTYVPGTAEAPGMTLNFAELVAANAAAQGVSAVFYGGLAWLFALVTTAVAIFVYLRPGAVVGAIAIAAGFIQLIIAFLAFKGPATMAMVIDGLPYIRLGSVFLFGGFILLILAGVALLALRPAASANPVRATSSEPGAPVTA